MRPPVASSIVAATCAIATGVRAKIGVTPVPSLTRSVTWPNSVSTVNASRPAICVV